MYLHTVAYFYWFYQSIVKNKQRYIFKKNINKVITTEIPPYPFKRK